MRLSLALIKNTGKPGRDLLAFCFSEFPIFPWGKISIGGSGIRIFLCVCHLDKVSSLSGPQL